MPNTGELLSHPLVLRGAWMRVDSWYRSGNLAPQPELARWRLHAESELRSLGADLLRHVWAPGPWRQVPYPKKAACLRHYVMPSVRDQVAFMAWMVLLGPLIDDRTENFAFGNRWHRPIAWDRRGKPSRWVHRPYQMLSDQSYRPYARSHGLFRRVAHWTVARITRSALERGDYAGPVQMPEDFPSDALPGCVLPKWWAGRGTRDRRAWWATLDIQLAYPSIRLDRLGRALDELLGAQLSSELATLLGGYPGDVVEALASTETRGALARDLIDALGRIQVDRGVIPTDAWRPPHAPADLPPDGNVGLPTGLAISGLLLNAALAPVDKRILRFLRAQPSQHRCAFLRFADDMVLLSRSLEGLLELVEAVWQALAGDGHARLDVVSSRSNLYLNLDKVGPGPVRELVRSYLGTQGWRKCEQCDTHVPPPRPTPPRSLVQWWKRQQLKESPEAARLRGSVEGTSVGADDLGPFVTTLVERLSEIGRDTLADRFGDGARERLVRLHDLARFDIDDEQVRADTRRTFAANRLVRAWLPDGDEASLALLDVRQSVAHVLRETPWKFVLWRAVVRAAARRTGEAGPAQADRSAQAWLQTQLRRIAVAGARALPSGSWLRTWPEPVPKNSHPRDDAWRHLYLSFHRAAFWHAVAEAVRELWQHHDRQANPEPGDPGASPGSWAVRAVPRGGQGEVARWLGGFDKWIEVLYPLEDTTKLDERPWELDALVEAQIAACPRSDAADALRGAVRSVGALSIPGSLEVLANSPRTRSLLKRNGRLLEKRDGDTDTLDASALALVQLAGRDTRLGNLLFPAGERTRLSRGVHSIPGLVPSLSESLGVGGFVPRPLARKGVLQAAAVIARLRSDPLFLWEYGQARGVLLGHRMSGPGRPPTLHRLLWGPEPGSRDLVDWRPRPWETPAVGLPVRVVCFMFVSARSAHPPRDWRPSLGPLTWCHAGEHALLAAGRRHQFDLLDDMATLREAPAIPGPRSEGAVRRSMDWDVPPHPAYFLPCLFREVEPAPYVLYCDVLLLLTALDGGEAILDRIVQCGLGAVPFEDRWAWRSRIVSVHD